MLFQIYFNYIFEDSGSREIIYVDNLCGNYRPDSLERDVQLLILTKFANTDKCPIERVGLGKIINTSNINE